MKYLKSSIILFLFIGVALIFTFSVVDNDERKLERYETSLSKYPIKNIRGSYQSNIYLAPTLEVPFKLNTFGLVLQSYPMVINTSQNNQSFTFKTYNELQSRKQIAVFNNQYDKDVLGGISNNNDFAFVNGRKLEITDKYLDLHDFIIHKDNSFTMMKYGPDPDSGLLHLEIEKLTQRGDVIWSWTSHNLIDPKWSTQDQEPPEVTQGINKFVFYVKTLRQHISKSLFHSFPSLYARLVKIQLFNKTLLAQWRNFSNIKDYVHGNSIQYFDSDQKILVSARHLDAVFAIDIATKTIVWALGGKFNKMTKNLPINDPRQGFSHQHTARIFDNKLYIFDNANLYSLPSRVVIYDVDEKNLNKARFLFHYIEPNGLTRTSMGSVQPIDENNILIGWGGVKLSDRKKSTAAVSIIDIKKNAVKLQVDFNPGWTSYQADTPKSGFIRSRN